MTSATETHNEQTVEVTGKRVRVLHDGNGPALVYLHHSTGNPGWIPFYDALAKSFTVYVPDMPGYGQSDRPEWAREPRDLAILVLRTLDKLGLQKFTLVGAGFGGFVAAEAATMAPERLDKLVLIGAAGLQPEEGEILDEMLTDYVDYVKASFSSEDAYTKALGEAADEHFKELWDFSREMTARLTWKPYMFSRRMGPILSEVKAPALIIWGSEDKIVPSVCGKQYQQALPNAKLEVVQGAGHLVEFEQPDKVAQLVSSAK